MVLLQTVHKTEIISCLSTQNVYNENVFRVSLGKTVTITEPFKVRKKD